MFHIKNKVKDFRISVFDEEFFLKKVTKKINIDELVNDANYVLNKINHMGMRFHLDLSEMRLLLSFWPE